MLAVCVAALVRGDGEERLFGAVYLGACVASLAVEKRPWTGLQDAIVVIDALVLAVAVGIVLASRKLWPIGAAAFQILTLAAHLAFMFAEGRLSIPGYLTVLLVWSYGTVGCLACGLRPRLPIPLRWRPLDPRSAPSVASPATDGAGETPGA